MTRFAEENQLKSQSGQNAKMLIGERLYSLRDDTGLGIEIKHDYSAGYEGKEKQFKMHFSVRFTDFGGEKWLIWSTNSIRERIYNAEYFAQHIKNIDEDVSRVLVVVPDSISDKEMKNKQNYAKKVKSSTYVSFIDDVLTVNELQQEILAKVSGIIAQGVRANILGSFSEKNILNLLLDQKNLELWNDYHGSSQLVKSSTFNYFKAILSAAGLSMNEDVIDVITATDSIPRLSNRGAPKTDVSFTVYTDSRAYSRNISIKNSTEKTVSIHEGNVSDLIAALRIDPSCELASALRHFEECGSKKELVSTYPHCANVLEQRLGSYNKELAEFFIFGMHSLLVTDPMQVADMVLFINPFAVWTRDKYIPYYLSKYQNRGQFATPFGWTYPSKKRGQKIQIKGYTSSS
ncbi:MAG: MspI family type II restriction endonuclease [Oscillospiraceae bacterium]|nr:MspI family type II restriction endonuclease [Oscillospiraceae bacterium]